MTPKEALEQLKEACNAEGYDFRGSMGDDLKLNELIPVFTDLVNRFGSIPPSITIEELMKKLSDEYEVDMETKTTDNGTIYICDSFDSADIDMSSVLITIIDHKIKHILADDDLTKNKWLYLLWLNETEIVITKENGK